MTETTLVRKTIRECREELGLTQTELGELSGCAQHSVSNVERGYVALHGKAGRQITRTLRGLGVDVDEIIGLDHETLEEVQARGIWAEDGLSPEAPARPLSEWRLVRGLTQLDLCLLSGVSRKAIDQIEHRHHDRTTPRTRHRLAAALRVRPDRLILAGDPPQPSRELSREALVDARYRRAVRIMRRWQDAARDGRYLTRRAEEELEGLIRDTARELEGT